MNITPNTRQVTLLLLLAAGVALPQTTTWKGMLHAQPSHFAVTSEARLLNLTGFRECTVLVESLPDELKDSLTKDDVVGWTENRLKNMGVRIVSYPDQRNAFFSADQGTDEKALAAQDRFRSNVYVNVNAGRAATGAIYANVSLACRRGVFVHPGYFTDAKVWTNSMLFYFTSGYAAKDQIRTGINELLDVLESDWKKCNP